MIRVTFLGTAAARPTVGRNVSSIAVQREGDLMLFDCGEGTQRQMMRYGSGFAVEAVFFTHMHADHFLGIIGLLRTMALQGREQAIDLYAPRGAGRILEDAVALGVERVGFRVGITEMVPGEAVRRDEYDVVAFEVAHGPAAVGWALVEHDRLGRFDVEKARALGVPEGPLFGRLHQGESVEVDGRTVAAEDVVGPARSGRRIVYTGDTRAVDAVRQAAMGADLLIHDCTFGAEETERARDTNHATSVEAAELAVRAGVSRLALTHLSARYSDSPGLLEAEARRVFPESVVAYDGLVIEVPYRTESPAGDVDEGGEA